VFASSAFGGIGYAEGMTMGSQVTTQLIGVGATLLWSGVLTFVLLKLVDVLIGLRVTTEEETQGLDTVLHNETGYNL
jgi:Amt family ammonium transporter